MKLPGALIALAAFLIVSQAQFGRSSNIAGDKPPALSHLQTWHPSIAPRGVFDKDTGFFHFSRTQTMGAKMKDAFEVNPQKLIAQMRAANKDGSSSSPLPSLPGSPIGSPSKPSRLSTPRRSSSYHSAQWSLPSTPGTPRTPSFAKTPSIREDGVFVEHRAKGRLWRKMSGKLKACLSCSKSRRAL